MALFRNRNVLIGTSDDLDTLPADLRPGTMFFNQTTKYFYILGSDGTWYGVNRYEYGETEALYEYHEGV